MKITAVHGDCDLPDAEFVPLPLGMYRTAQIMLGDENVADRCRWVDPLTGEAWLYDTDDDGNKMFRRTRRGLELAGSYVRGVIVQPHPGFEDAWAALAVGGAPGAAIN